MTDFERYVEIKGFLNGEECDRFLINLKAYHPGVPGYAVKYEYYVTFDGEQLNDKEFKILSDKSLIGFFENKIVIPDEVRQSGETITITATYCNEEEYTSVLKIKLKKWEQTLEDNFDTYNKELWSGLDWGAKTNLSTTPVKDNYVKNSQLCLEFTKLEEPIVKDGVEYWYTDAGVSSQGKFSQRYGCFTSKMKVPSGRKGLFTAFWLLPEGRYTKDYFFKRTDTGDDFHGCSEIDIMEVFNDPDTKGSAHTEHYWAPDWDTSINFTKSSTGSFYLIPGFKYGEYQEYSCVWTEYGIYYYVNGELAKSNTNIAPVENVMEAYIIYSCYIAPKGSDSWWGEVKDEDLPQEFVVDWLRVYR